MITKKILYNNKYRKNIIKSVNKLINPVKKTLGPKGINILIEKTKRIIITKDGVTVVKNIILKNKLNNFIAKIIKNIALKTNNEVGDGTTTALVIAQKIITESIKYINLGESFENIKKGIIKTLNKTLKYIKKYHKKLTTYKQILQIATIASNDKNIGNIILKAIKNTKKEGNIIIKKSNSLKDKLIIKKVLQINKGYDTCYTIVSNKIIILYNPYILLYDSKISSIKDILIVLNKITKIKKSLFIICNDIDKNTLDTLIINYIKNIINVVLIKINFRYKYLLNDIAFITNGKIFKKRINKSDINANILKKIKKVEIYKNKTFLFIKKIDNSKLVKNNIVYRISKLEKKIGIIRIGGSSDIEKNEKKYRIKNALNATKFAISKGIIPGGGTVLIKIINLIKQKIKFNSKEISGMKIMFEAMQTPLIQIMKNGNINPGFILSNIKNMKFGYGYDLNTNKYCNLYKVGIIDSAEILKSSLKNSILLSLMLLSTNCVIYNK